jgi:16S rRNA (cytidine1402-2'-O)-methyltransferase
LLQKYDIRAKLIPYNDHSTSQTRQKVLSLIRQGNVVSIVSDAGTPLISDPGYKLVNYLRDEDCYIDALPGPCSAIAALCLSGMPSDRFLFMGFMPKTLGEKASTLQQVTSTSATLIFFETAGRILDSLKTALSVLGNRNCAIVREISKMYQEVMKDSLQNLVAKLEASPALKGEIVLLIEKSEQSFEEGEIVSKIKSLQDKGFSTSDAAKIISTLFNVNKGDVYNLAKTLK